MKISKFAAIILTAAIWIADAPQGAHAQASDEPSIPEITPDHPDRERLRRWMAEYAHNQEIQRLQAEAALRQGRLTLLEQRQEDLPASIQAQESLLSLVKSGLFGAIEEEYWDGSDTFWFTPKFRYPLILYDYIEKWIPEFERHRLEWMRQRGITELKYSLYQVWQWAIPLEEANLRELEDELAGLPERIEEASRASIQADEDLRKGMLEVNRNAETPETNDVNTDNDNQPADVWRGKWDFQITYLIAKKTFNLLLEVDRNNDGYYINIENQNDAIISTINETILEFNFDDELNTNVKLRMTGVDSFIGNLTIPNERPSGNIVGERISD